MGRARRTKQEKEYDAHFRQEKIIKLLSVGKASSAKMAQRFNVSRGQIIQDIRDLRRSGYPIQTSSMTTERGMYVAVFELPKGYQLKA